MKKIGRKVTSIIITLVLLIGTPPMPVYAAESETGSEELTIRGTSNQGTLFSVSGDNFSTGANAMYIANNRGGDVKARLSASVPLAEIELFGSSALGLFPHAVQIGIGLIKVLR